MSLHKYWEKINPRDSIAFDEEGRPLKFPLVRKIWLALLIILVGTLGFGLGKLSNLGQSEPVQINMVDIDNNQETRDKIQINSNSTNSAVSASSKGTRYYYSWCKNTISEKNKVTFATALLAEKAGYALATNCKPR